MEDYYSEYPDTYDYSYDYSYDYYTGDSYSYDYSSYNDTGYQDYSGYYYDYDPSYDYPSSADYGGQPVDDYYYDVTMDAWVSDSTGDMYDDYDNFVGNAYEGYVIEEGIRYDWVDGYWVDYDSGERYNTEGDYVDNWYVDSSGLQPRDDYDPNYSDRFVPQDVNVRPLQPNVQTMGPVAPSGSGGGGSSGGGSGGGMSMGGGGSSSGSSQQKPQQQDPLQALLAGAIAGLLNPNRNQPTTQQRNGTGLGVSPTTLNAGGPRTGDTTTGVFNVTNMLLIGGVGLAVVIGVFALGRSSKK